MFRKKSDRELWELQQELLAVEEEDYEEEELDLFPEDAIEELDLPEEEAEGEDIEEYFDGDYADEEEIPLYRNHANGYGENVRNYANRYGRGSQKKFDDDDFFDEEDFSDEDVLYQKDYRKAKKKKKRQNFGLAVLAVIEIIAIAAIAIWWATWML